MSEYLLRTLTLGQQARIAFLSFNQWTFTTAALIDTALSAHAAGIEVKVAFWADSTPLQDSGWTTSRTIARLSGSKTICDSAKNSLKSQGLPNSCFVSPPFRRWKTDVLPAVPGILTRVNIRQLSYKGAPMGRSILQVHPDFNTPIRNDYIWPRRWISAAMRSYAWTFDQTQALIREQGLTAIVVYNGRFMHDQAAAAAATSLGIQVLYYDTGGLDTGFDLTGASTHDWSNLQNRMIDLFARFSDQANEDFQEDFERTSIQWFLNRQGHTEPGIELFVGEQKHGHLGELPETEQLVVFFSSSGDEIVELDLDWTQHLESQEEAVRALARACARRPGTKLVVRTHPHMRIKPADDLARWTEMVESAGVDLHIDPHSPVDSYALMRAADVVFTYGSTSGVEAAFLGRPVVIMGPSAYDRLGFGQKISTESEIGACLDNPPDPNSTAALPYGLMMQRRGFNYESVSRGPFGEILLEGELVPEASSFTRKLSDFYRNKRFAWLTAK